MKNALIKLMCNKEFIVSINAIRSLLFIVSRVYCHKVCALSIRRGRMRGWIWKTYDICICRCSEVKDIVLHRQLRHQSKMKGSQNQPHFWPTGCKFEHYSHPLRSDNLPERFLESTGLTLWLCLQFYYRKVWNIDETNRMTLGGLQSLIIIFSAQYAENCLPPL